MYMCMFQIRIISHKDSFPLIEMLNCWSLHRHFLPYFNAILFTQAGNIALKGHCFSHESSTLSCIECYQSIIRDGIRVVRDANVMLIDERGR